MIPSSFKRIDKLIRNAFPEKHHVMQDWETLSVWIKSAEKGVAVEEKKISSEDLLSAPSTYATLEELKEAIRSGEVGSVNVYMSSYIVGEGDADSYAWVITSPDGCEILLPTVGGFEEERLSAPRKNLIVLIAMLKQMVVLEPQSIDFFVDNEYVNKGIRVWMKAWRAKGWKTRDGGEVKNGDLWKEVSKLLGIVEDFKTIGMETKKFSMADRSMCRHLSTAVAKV